MLSGVLGMAAIDAFRHGSYVLGAVESLARSWWTITWCRSSGRVHGDADGAAAIMRKEQDEDDARCHHPSRAQSLTNALET
jgi:hypothetical protein